MREVYLHTLSNLAIQLSHGKPVALGAIGWASPVLAFGSPINSAVATLGLNPSNIEFVDRHGNELIDPKNRFETLRSLKLIDWKDASRESLERILVSCETYFHLSRRPYHAWFRPLDKVISGLGVSYYSELFPACHLDLVPFATSKKWAALDKTERAELIVIGARSLIDVLKASSIEVLVLNGSSVVKEFEKLVGCGLDKFEVSDWALDRSNSSNVRGFGFIKKVSSICGVGLGRDILVLGFNHNIQSSFGVKGSVISSIRDWIAEQVKQNRIGV